MWKSIRKQLIQLVDFHYKIEYDNNDGFKNLKKTLNVYFII